ncbi:MAG: hypothetical protein ABIJ08_04765, partial [Nanoarchaeota archaeon]
DGRDYRVIGNAASDGKITVPISLFTGDNILHIKSTDPRSNVNETQYNIFVDTDNPILTITSAIPVQTQEKSFTVNGTVNENVTLTITFEYVISDTTGPVQITGLKNVTIGPNSVELEWDASTAEDLKEYLVYRDGVLIASKTENSFADQINASDDYTYQIGTIDNNCNYGVLSNALTILTPEGPDNVTGTVEEYNVECENKEIIEMDVNGSFSHDLEMDLDGFYTLNLRAVDLAGNSVSTSRNIYLDTMPPEITELDPAAGTKIYEQFADEVDIKGKTDPYAKVWMYVKRTPLGAWENDEILERTAEILQTIQEGNFSVNSDLESRADYETVADANGYFSFSNVDITSSAVLAERIHTVNYAEIHEDVNVGNLDAPRTSNLLFIAQDAFGQRGMKDVNYEVQTCWSGDFDWSAAPLLEFQSPIFISPERLAEGSETLYFFFNFTYIGGQPTEDKPIIGDSGVTVESACDDYIKRDPVYNHSCQMLTDRPELVRVIRGQTAYVQWKLNAYEGMADWGVDEWNDFFDVMKGGEIKFPLKFTVNYQVEDEVTTTDVTTGQLKTERVMTTKVQTFCDSVSYYVDIGRIQPDDVLPDWLLYDFVDFLDEIINTTTKWIEKIDEIMEYVAIGCVASYFGVFLTKILKHFNCRVAKFSSAGIISSGSPFGAGGFSQECHQCLTNFDKNPAPKDIVGDMDSMSDTCLKVCYPSCAAAWETEATWYTFFRWTCDRLFGHSSPTKRTEGMTDDQLKEAVKGGSRCTNDQSELGRPLKSVNCRNVVTSYSGLTASRFGTDDKCIEVTGPSGTNSLYKVDRRESGYIYKLKHMGGPVISNMNYVIEQNTNTYMGPQASDCATLCGQTVRGSRGPITASDIVDVLTYKLTATGVAPTGTTARMVKGASPAVGFCATKTQCEAERDKTWSDGSKTFEVKTAVTIGYTTDCFYGNAGMKDAKVVSGNPETRIECCCLTNSEDISIGRYYQPQDVESKTKPATPPSFNSGHAGDTPGDMGKKLADMKWSYRYDSIKWKAPTSLTGNVRDQYNPKRYAEARDKPACFGQDAWLSSEKLALNPSSDHIAALQCVDISGIRNRLIMIRNLASMLKNCLIQVRTTGRADSGVCKELFSQYVCALIWKIISYIKDGCLDIGFLEQGDTTGWTDYLSAGVGATLDSVRESQNLMNNEYGNANMNNLLGMGEDAIARKVCLAAFGYDWDISLDDFVDAAKADPYATLVQPVLPTREYITFDPLTAYAIYDYKGSWLINPGCDFDGYTVSLVCVTKEEVAKYNGIRCDEIGAPDGQHCPCTKPGANNPTNYLIHSGGALTQNVLVDVDHTMWTNNRIVKGQYRYDHLKFEIDASNIAEAHADVSRCFPEGHTEGTKGIFYYPIRDITPRDIVACQIEATGVFDCKVGFGLLTPFGEASISAISIKDYNVDLSSLNTADPDGPILYKGESIDGSVTYFKDDKPKCLVYKLLDANKQPLHTILPVTLSGSSSGTYTHTFSFPATAITATQASQHQVTTTVTYPPVAPSTVSGQGGLNIEVTDSSGLA